PAGLLGETLPADPPVREEEHRPVAREGQPVAQRRPRGDRRLSIADRYLPRRALPPPRQTARQAKSPGRDRPLRPGHHLPPASRPRSPVPRPRPGLLRRPDQPGAQDRQPPPPAPGPRTQRHHRGSRLTAQPAQPLPRP